MSDSIVNCIVFKNSDGSIRSYDITFAFNTVIVPVSSNTITVWSESLKNPTSLIEVKQVACKQATAIKALYASVTSISDLNGPVTL